MNRRGFTLVELLAVIVLIAVLTVVAVSTYRGINESSKKKSLEAKITQIKAAAEKWARENNITSVTTLSVNNLVVEGYITADEVSPNGLSTIKNPVNGENMICNTIELSFKNGEIISKYRSDVQNCNLATQSLVDTKINITVVNSDNTTLSGTGSIAKWTNKNVVVIVNSTEYDPKAASISYDFEGSTTTKSISGLEKYTGYSYMEENETNKYYNVFFIKSELILNTNIVVTYDIPGEGTKSRAYTIRFDKEEATANLKSNTDWETNNQSIDITIDDGKGSGPRYYYMSTNSDSYNESSRKPASYNVTITNLEVGKYYIWTEDNAGNRSKEYKLIIDINNVDKEKPGCEITFSGTEGLHNWFISPVTPSTTNVPVASVSGVNIGLSNTSNPTYSAFASYNTQNTVTGPAINTDTTRAGIDYYCHVRSLAGKTDNASRNLKIDMTPPTVTLDITSDSVYSQFKTVTATVTDNLSGIDRVTNIRYAWALAGEQPSDWGGSSSFIVNPGESFETTNPMIGNGYTVIYYLWVDVSNVHDYAGNYATGVNDQGTIGVFGPYMFDNTPPTCNVGSLSNQCTTGGVSCVVSCTDDDSGVDSCPGSQSGLKSSTTFTATDKAGNRSTCGIEISSTEQYNKQNCSQYHQYRCNCGWGGLECYESDTNVSRDTETEQTGCTGCYDYSTCRHSFQCCTRRYTCSTCTDYNNCDGWGASSAWQNDGIANCNYPDCKVNTRTVYHSGGMCNAGNYSGVSSCLNTGLAHGNDVNPHPSVCD